MTPDQIERETLIAAPVERVWSVLTEAEHISGWFADARRGDRAAPRRRAHDALERAATSHARGGGGRAPRRFAYRWSAHHADADGEPAEGNSTLVEFTLDARGRRHAPARRRERVRVARATDDDQRAPTTTTTSAAGSRCSRSSTGTRSRWRPDRGARSGGLRRAGGPHALARADPDRRARRGDRDVAGRRAAGQPRRGGQAPRGARPRRAGRGPPRGPRGPLHGAPGAARRDGPLDGRPRARWDARLAAIKRLAEEG